MDATRTVKTQCCIAGGGPAGVMLGFLLARAGVDVYVLEKHADFFRDFRGDTIHPSTLELMYELGLLEAFLKVPHQEVREIGAQIGDAMHQFADFTHLPTHCKFLALMPQWDFLTFLTERAKRYPGFHLMMSAEVTDLITENDRVVGARVTTPSGPQEIRSDLVVGADGRHSTVREKSGLQILDIGAPMDVLWMRISREAGDPGDTLGRVDRGKILVMIGRDTYWQCGYIIPKGGYAALQAEGIAAFQRAVLSLAPFLGDRINELGDWKNISLLTVAVDRLEKWHRPGLLCIGDAAHAMSPIGGVGINLAVQDAVATANILAQPLLTGSLCDADLRAVQWRREYPTKMIQRIQVFVQNNVITRVLKSNASMKAPLPLRLLDRWPILRRIPARVVGIGFRPEHIETTEKATT